MRFSVVMGQQRDSFVLLGTRGMASGPGIAFSAHTNPASKSSTKESLRDRYTAL